MKKMDSVRLKCISGSCLKVIAILAMLLDHTTKYVFRWMDFSSDSLCVIAGHVITPAYLFVSIGRIAFPIFAFLIVEGYLHTHDRKKYAVNLLLFALLSEVPWNLVHHNSFLWPQYQNVFFTLLLGYLGICFYNYYRTNWIRRATSLVILFVIAWLLHADYGVSGFCFILLMYALRESKILRAVIGSGVLSSTWKAGLAFIPISMYDDRRGFIQGPIWKYLFYLFYPLHLLALYFGELYLVS